jgi:glycosyltransferase involved in cell wall biosynthesis
MIDFALVAAVNDPQIQARDIGASPFIGSTVLAERGHPTAGVAYNAGMSRSREDVVIFAHQDVYFPRGWNSRLAAAVEHLERAREPWAILGVWGIRPDRRYAGKVWCSGGHREHVARTGRPVVEVASIDEIVIVMNRRAGLRFDENLPGFHLYATDIILQARQKGYKAFIFDGPVVHNSRPNPNPLDRHFFAAYRYMQRKWADQLPVLTCTVPITRWGWPLYKRWSKREWRRLRGTVSGGQRVDDPAAMARYLGYEQADPLFSGGVNSDR